MKKVVFFLLLISISITSNAQLLKNRLTFGGGIGMQFSDYTHVNIAPQVGYNVNNYLNVGAGFTYSYFSDKYDHNQYKETNNYLGFNLYGKIYPIPYLVLMIQPEASRMWKSVEDRSTHEKVKKEKFIPVFLIGGGLRLGPMTAMIQYDAAQDSNSPYGNKFFYSVGYTFGF